MIKFVNYSWEINKYEYKELGDPIGERDGFFHLRKNGVEYRVPAWTIICLISTNKYFIKIGLVNKLMEKVG